MALDAPAASAWLRLKETARARFGVSLVLSSPAGAWRGPWLVEDMYRFPAKYGATKGVAKPKSLGGPGSVHENGLCVDVNNWAALGSKRLDALAAEFQFKRTITVEPWHFQYVGPMGGGGFAGGEIDVQLTDPITPETGKGDVNAYIYYTHKAAAAANVKIDALTAAVNALAVGAGLNPEALSTLIAQKVDAALADNFAAVPAAVIAEQKKPGN